MSPWYSAWLPSFPSIDFTLPSSIQRRFISFVLKRSLGHFLKPGQLDVNQIDSQIGAGFVQVKDLELDNEAINSALSGLPIQFHDGSIGSVSLQTSWQNPLTSTLRLSLQSTHLEFHLVPPEADLSGASMSRLEDSVASVAESFIHDELDQVEEATLRESFHPDLAASAHNVPGGLDPFLSATEDESFHGDGDPAGISIFASLIERLLSRFEFDAIDTEVTLVHPGRTSFTLSIREMLCRTEQEAHAKSDVSLNPMSDQSRGQTRTLSISGFNIFLRDLHLPISSPADLSPTSPKDSSRFRMASPHSLSPASSSSSLDEGTQFLMSQSIVSLPPRSHSPASPESSMYHSAISTLDAIDMPNPETQSSARSQSRTPSPGPRRMESSHHETPKVQPLSLKPSQELPDSDVETLLSFGTDPITVWLTTPHVKREQGSQASMQSPGPKSTSPSNLSEKLEVNVVTGVIACALRAWHIRSILEVAESWNLHSQSLSSRDSHKATQDVQESSMSISGLGIDGSIQVRGIVLLLLPPTLRPSPPGVSLYDTYFAHPMVPPQLPHGYVRVHLEVLDSSFSVQSSIPATAAESSMHKRKESDSTASTMTIKFSLSLTELSVFAFHTPTQASPEEEVKLIASPVLITDHQLPSQYSPHHVHSYDHFQAASKTESRERHIELPTFDLVDWTSDAHRTSSPKLSLWRTKITAHRSRGQTLPNIPPIPKAVSMEATRTVSITPLKLKQKYPRTTADSAEIRTLPLQIFVDVGLALSSDGLISFLEEAVPLSSGDKSIPQSQPNAHLDDDGNTSDEADAPAVSYLSNAGDRETERMRLERLVLEDLNLDLDYRQQAQALPLTSGRAPKHKSRTRKSKQQSNILAIFPMVRLQIRCPSPPSKVQRSGAVVLDLHSVKLSNSPSSTPGGLDLPKISGNNIVLVSVACQRILVASSQARESKATASLSLGPLVAPPETLPDEPPSGLATSPQKPDRRSSSPQLCPRLTLSKIRPSNRNSASASASPMVITADIPSMNVHLSKPVVDSVQYWIDDIAQLLERISNVVARDTDTESGDSRDTSLIGSRFFAKSLRSKSSGGGSRSTLTPSRSNTNSEVVIKLVIAEAFARIALPRGTSVERPFDLIASEVDVLTELKPEGNDETVITLGMMDASLIDTSPHDQSMQLLSLTTPRNLVRSLSVVDNVGLMQEAIKMSSPKSLLKLRFSSLVVPETTIKESRIKLTLCGFTYDLRPDFSWVSDLETFFKSPPGTFESVIPSERTKLFLKIMDGSIRAATPSHPGALVVHLEELEFSTNIVGASPEKSFHLSVPIMSSLFLDDVTADSVAINLPSNSNSLGGVPYWKGQGFVLFAEISDLGLDFKKLTMAEFSDTRVEVEHAGLRLHLCADTLSPLSSFIGDLISPFQPPIAEKPQKPKGVPATISAPPVSRRGILSTVEEHAFQRIPEVGPTPDMIYDDLPSNLDYLDESFGTAAGLRELRDDDLDDFDREDLAEFNHASGAGPPRLGIISNVGGETIKIFRPEGLHIIENYFDTLPPESVGNKDLGETTLRVRLYNCDITLFLYDGFDWAKTRKTIEDGIKEMRRRLAKIRQLVASGQKQDPKIEEQTSTLLFNSVYVGLDQEIDSLDTGALIAAIDDELNDDLETASQSSWQSLRPASTPKHRTRPSRMHGKRLTRSKSPSIEIRLMGLNAEVDHYRPGESLVSRTFVTVRDAEILDHIKTSTWKKFLTELRSDIRGNVRETDSNMVRVELRSVRPVPEHPAEEARLRAKILPLRLYVDQDALDFLKKFFSFQDPQSNPSTESNGDEIFLQLAEVFPVDIKLDYKPRRVDYRALREGRTIELMNFFHFDGAEMTLRHITLSGITGWARLFEMLNDLWTPDVKATQLVDVISGVSPIRSMVNVGSGVADLVLLPIAQYKKDGRIVRGVQKGTTAFVKSTAMEAIKLGTRLATGTQVILEQAEGVLGGQFKHPVTARTLQSPTLGDSIVSVEPGEDEDEETTDLISKYAEQPLDVTEGVQSAYRSLRKNFQSAAQTILAVPMEVYEQSNEGVVSAVIRAVPIAVLKPMIGASEAISKTLMGLQNALDPEIRHENEAKYKQR